jgi:hypothetical protein
MSTPVLRRSWYTTVMVAILLREVLMMLPIVGLKTSTVRASQAESITMSNECMMDHPRREIMRFAEWQNGGMTYVDTKTGARIADDADRGVLLVQTSSRIHGYIYSAKSFASSGRYVLR